MEAAEICCSSLKIQVITASILWKEVMVKLGGFRCLKGSIRKKFQSWAIFFSSILVAVLIYRLFATTVRRNQSSRTQKQRVRLESCSTLVFWSPSNNSSTAGNLSNGLLSIMLLNWNSHSLLPQRFLYQRTKSLFLSFPFVFQTRNHVLTQFSCSYQNNSSVFQFHI